MPARRRDVVRLMTAASVSALAPLSAARAREVFFLFFPPPPAPPSPVVVVRPQVLQQSGLLARDAPPLHPARPPAPLCYAAAATCPLEPAGVPGGPCSCPSENGRVAGRALIPPSRKLG